jgi:hypothetical protein
MRSRREAILVEHLVEQDARVIAGKWPAGTIRAVHPWCQADNQEASALVTERRHGSAVVVRVSVTNVVEERCEARTGTAVGVEDHESVM